LEGLIEAALGTRRRRMDAMTLLREDHRKVKKLLAKIESTTERGVKTRQDLFTKVKQELVVHERSRRRFSTQP
jgi:hypothetical protein